MHRVPNARFSRGKNGMKEKKIIKKTAKDRPSPVGADGKPMTVWQIWLKRLCFIMIAWAVIELLIGIVLLFASNMVPPEVFHEFERTYGINSQDAGLLLSLSAVVGAFLNVVIAFLGIRGAENPQKIVLFFWIALVDAVITAWALASNISNGLIDPSSFVSGIFIIALAVCAWEVRGQTGYFDRHP